ncbi:transporter [Paractinoplanes lichenicola]|uniref:Transporter n=1 Tax=Paractinoplanes lichenicola TaxID=2802976 RepID=A0ABS1W2E3_9ACTN|nr:transporter [Actinoplanes lichenicola]MBL7260911.1 transporter [Actinoplanes lichenicola]
MTPIDDDAPPLDPAESLALIERERHNLGRDLAPDPRLMFWPWGIAWLAGFTLFFLRFGPDGRVFVNLPEWLPLVALALLMVAAGITTGIAGSKVSRRVTGPSTRQGAMYGISWSIAFTAFSILFSQFSDLLPEDKAGLLWAGGMVALTGALHMAGGAVWNDRELFALGAWTSVINIAGILIGPGWHALIVAVAGGGGMIVAGLIGWLRLR